jgi:hypothetical protein
MANARRIVTRTCGSFSRRSGSSAGEPITNEPDGTITISGQLRHSLNVCPGSTVFDGFRATAVCAVAAGTTAFTVVSTTTARTSRTMPRLVMAPRT